MVVRFARSAERQCGAFVSNLRRPPTTEELFSVRVVRWSCWKPQQNASGPEGDEATPQELAREIAAGIRGSRLVVIPDSGHLSTLEQPTAVTKALVEWLKS